MDINEKDIHGRNVIALVYADFRDQPISVKTNK